MIGKANGNGLDEGSQLFDRFSSYLWVTDIDEYYELKGLLVCADTTSRLLADKLESIMAVYTIGQKDLERFDPAWYSEYWDMLVMKYGRDELLTLLQGYLFKQNKEGYTYQEEVEVLQEAWGQFKQK